MVRINSLKKVSLILSLALVGMACTTTPKNTEETMESLTQYVEPPHWYRSLPLVSFCSGCDAIWISETSSSYQC